MLRFGYNIWLAGAICGTFYISSISANEQPLCRYLPGDKNWPSREKWSNLNATINGRLIATVPLAKSCYGPNIDATTCNAVKNTWVRPELHVFNAASVQNPYWLNNSCSPFTASVGSCVNGNLPEYSIKVTSAKDAIAGVKFAQKNNIRLVIKNTGHDFLGRSTGKGSLNLWTHNLKDISIFDYKSKDYKGKALRLGAGVQGYEVYQAADKAGVRIVGGFCPTVGIAGGFTQGAGHGPLIGEYGLAADNVLEWEVVTAEGQHVIATPSKNSDLYWALSGGGGGTYGVVISLTTRAHQDGPVGGASLRFTNQNITADTYWNALKKFHDGLAALTEIPGVQVTYSITSSYFYLNFLTWPDHTAEEVAGILRPFTKHLEDNGISYDPLYTYQPRFYPHYAQFTPQLPFGYYEISEIIGGRLIPYSVVEKNNDGFIAALRNITTRNGGDQWFTNGVAANLTHARVGNKPGINSVLPAWRDSLVFFNVVVVWQPDAPLQELVDRENEMTYEVVPQLERITPGSGTYINEGDFNNPNWKWDYFGPNYNRLLAVKKKYDPKDLFYGIASVGNEVWRKSADGRLCKAGRNQPHDAPW